MRCQIENSSSILNSTGNVATKPCVLLLSSACLPKLLLSAFAILRNIFTLYSMLAKKLRGFEDCDAHKLYRHFVRGKGTISIRNQTVTVTYPRRAHNPILRSVQWDQLP